MSKQKGIEKAKLQAFPVVSDRLSFLYIEHCVVNRKDGAICVIDERGTVHVPAAGLGVLMLGPGTNVTHRAMELLGDAGTSVLWVGEHGVRFYAGGRALTHSSRLLEQQARLVSNVRLRVAVARKMYLMRFPNEDVSELTMQQLRGREGARVRSVYRQWSKQTGVAWQGREYVPGDGDAGDLVNRALTLANACLYGVVHSVIVALGCSPGLGFVHCGHERSFVYDIADLYKATYSISVAFEVAAEEPEDVERAVRFRMRDHFAQDHILRMLVRDIKTLLEVDESTNVDGETFVEELFLWDDKLGLQASGISYAEQTEAEVQCFRGYGKFVEDGDALGEETADVGGEDEEELFPIDE